MGLRVGLLTSVCDVAWKSAATKGVTRDDSDDKSARRTCTVAGQETVRRAARAVVPRIQLDATVPGKTALDESGAPRGPQLLTPTDFTFREVGFRSLGSAC